MKDNNINKRAYVFDLDDCLIKTPARSHVYRNGVYYRSLTPAEFNTFKSTPEDRIDFSEFEDGRLIREAEKYKAWKVLQNVSNKINKEESTSSIFILTARHKVVKMDIYYLLTSNDINIPLENIITMGDGKGQIDIAHEKKLVLQDMSKKYDEMYFFDDDIKNIEVASSVEGVKPRLIKQNI